jgi:actin related protein 2/3 complex, subunit 4
MAYGYMTPHSDVKVFSRDSRDDFRDQLALHLTRNLCLRDFPCQEVERQSKPEIEFGTCRELLLPPVTVQCSASGEKCLIEPSINATRVNFMFNWGGELPEGLDKILADSLFKFLGVKADQFPLLRRAPVDGYDVSFLITDNLLQRYGMMNIVISMVTFAMDTPGYLARLKGDLELQNLNLGKSVFRVFGKIARPSD